MLQLHIRPHLQALLLVALVLDRLVLDRPDLVHREHRRHHHLDLVRQEHHLHHRPDLVHRECHRCLRLRWVVFLSRQAALLHLRTRLEALPFLYWVQVL